MKRVSSVSRRVSLQRHTSITRGPRLSRQPLSAGRVRPKSPVEHQVDGRAGFERLIGAHTAGAYQPFAVVQILSASPALRLTRGFLEKGTMSTLTELFTRKHETRSTTETRFRFAETRLAEGGVKALSAAKPGTPDEFDRPQ